MKRSTKSLIFILSVAGVMAFALWYKNLQRERVQLESQVTRMESQIASDEQRQRRIVQLRNQLAGERQRLDGLRDNLAAIVNMGQLPPTGSIDAHLGNLTRQIATLENQLRGLQSQAQATRQNARGFVQQSRTQILNRRVDIEQELQNLTAQMSTAQANLRATQGEVPTPDRDQRVSQLLVEIERLRASRQQLSIQLQSLNTAEQSTALAADQQLQGDQTEIEIERENLLAQLEDLRADLTYWQQQKTARSPATNTTPRVQQIQEQIQTREQRLNGLDEEIKRLSTNL